jgi:hypothetical protein
MRYHGETYIHEDEVGDAISDATADLRTEIEHLKEAITSAMLNLGVPHHETPASIETAYDILRDALEGNYP